MDILSIYVAAYLMYLEYIFKPIMGFTNITELV